MTEKRQMTMTMMRLLGAGRRICGGGEIENNGSEGKVKLVKVPEAS
jgi:hypothetical protein